MKRLVQCVPNFSEGINKKTIEAIVAPLKNKAGFTLIGYEADPDYNRTVVTLLGDPEAMMEPLCLFIQKAIEKIDLRKHQGNHPRMGAVDVVPFIPIKGIKMAECITYAKQLAEKVSTFQIPVFLYGKAATKPERESLPAIRQGEFEGMKEKLLQPEWIPDYGPRERHETFGVVAIGARMPLIAFNIDLMSPDKEIASTIAKTIRKSSGGFQYVQAGPAYLNQRGHIQVTMNILDYTKNPIYRLLEMVKMEAKRYLIDVPSCELIGLVPRKALEESVFYYLERDQKNKSKFSIAEIAELAVFYLGLRDFNPGKIIESHLKE